MSHQIAIGSIHTSSLLLHVALILFGLVNCFYGYRIFRILLGVWGFLGGAALGLGILQGTNLSPVGQALGAALAGILGVFLVSVLYLVGVFLYGAGVGYIVAMAVVQAWPSLPRLPLSIVLCLLGGIAAVALQSPLIKILTAFGGAWLVVASIAGISSGRSLMSLPHRLVDSDSRALIALIAWLLLGIFGMAVQMGTSRRRRMDEDDSD